LPKFTMTHLLHLFLVAITLEAVLLLAGAYTIFYWW
jgi:hypothetical protein